MPPSKRGARPRRSTSPITATYLSDQPASATLAQALSFDVSTFATTTGSSPLADSPAAPLAQPTAAASAPPAAAATGPCPHGVRSSKLSHLSAEDAAAEKARLIKEQVYESFIKGGMSSGDARHFVDTMPQCLIDQAEELESDEEEGGSDEEDASEGEEDDSEGDEDASEGETDEEDSEGEEEESEEEYTQGGGKSVTLWKCVLEDGEGGKYKICDRASDHKVPSCGQYVQRMSARIGKAELDGGAALIISWDGAVGFRLPLRGKCTGSGLVIDLNGEVPQIPTAKGDYGSDLYAACRTAVQLTLDPGGHWTRQGASAAWSPLFD